MYYESLAAAKKTVLSYLIQAFMVSVSVKQCQGLIINAVTTITKRHVISWFETYPNLSCSLHANGPYAFTSACIISAISWMKVFAKLFPTTYLGMNHKRVAKYIISMILILVGAIHVVLAIVNGTICQKVNATYLSYKLLITVDFETAPPTVLHIYSLIVVSELIYKWLERKQVKRIKPLPKVSTYNVRNMGDDRTDVVSQIGTDIERHLASISNHDQSLTVEDTEMIHIEELGDMNTIDGNVQETTFTCGTDLHETSFINPGNQSATAENITRADIEESSHLSAADAKCERVATEITTNANSRTDIMSKDSAVETADTIVEIIPSNDDSIEIFGEMDLKDIQVEIDDNEEDTFEEKFEYTISTVEEFTLPNAVIKGPEQSNCRFNFTRIDSTEGNDERVSIASQLTEPSARIPAGIHMNDYSCRLNITVEEQTNNNPNIINVEGVPEMSPNNDSSLSGYSQNLTRNNTTINNIDQVTSAAPNQGTNLTFKTSRPYLVDTSVAACAAAAGLVFMHILSSKLPQHTWILIYYLKFVAYCLILHWIYRSQEISSFMKRKLNQFCQRNFGDYY